MLLLVAAAGNGVAFGPSAGLSCSACAVGAYNADGDLFWLR